MGNFLLEERKFLGKIVFFWNPAVDRYLSLVRACDCSHDRLPGARKKIFIFKLLSSRFADAAAPAGKNP